MNKVNTKVDMRLNVSLAAWISEDLKDALQRLVHPLYTTQHLVPTSTLKHPNHLRVFFEAWLLGGFPTVSTEVPTVLMGSWTTGACYSQHVVYSASYSDNEVRMQEKKRINKEGELVVTSTATRSQA